MTGLYRGYKLRNARLYCPPATPSIPQERLNTSFTPDFSTVKTKGVRRYTTTYS